MREFCTREGKNIFSFASRLFPWESPRETRHMPSFLRHRVATEKDGEVVDV